MRATLLVAALAVCTGSLLVHADILHSFEEASESCVAKVTDLQSHLTDVHAENTALRGVNEQLTGVLAENIALREVNKQLASSLDECRAGSVKQPQRLITAVGYRLSDEQLSTATMHEDAPAPPVSRISVPRRRALTTPAPTPLTPIPTPIPTPLTPIPTTATPSATPTASPVPTTEGVTTHSQLAAAVANTDDVVVVVEGDVTFPSLSVIPVFSGRSVSVVGRSAVDGGRVVFDGAGHSQHFWVKGEGSVLHISFVKLANGTASLVDSNCRRVDCRL